MSETETRSEELRIRVRPSEVEALRKIAERDEETTVSAEVRKAIRNHIERELGK